MGDWTEAWGVVGVALSWGSCRNLAPSPIPGGKWVAPLSPTRVHSGRPRQAGVRALTMVHLAWAPGLPIQPGTITALQPQAQWPPGAGGLEGSRWASGVRFPVWGGEGAALEREGEGVGLLPTPQQPLPASDPQRKARGPVEVQSGKGEVGGGLSAHHHCHLEQGGGETGPEPGLS